MRSRLLHCICHCLSLSTQVQVPTSPKHSVSGEEMSAEIKVALRFLPQTSHSKILMLKFMMMTLFI